MFDAVIFDYFGTLTPGLPVDRVAASMARVGRALDVDSEAFAAEMKRSWVERCTGMMGDSRSILAEVARRCHAGPAIDLDAAQEIRLRDFGAMAQLRPEARGVLVRLRATLGVAIVSDCPPELAELWASLEVSALVDHAVLSSVLGMKKPDPEMFLRAAAGLGVAPGRCLYVGDGGSGELRGARSVGMTVLKIVDEGDLYVHDVDPTVDIPEILSLTDVERHLGTGGV
jgi:putative hydrolase of the HAD superfamily